MQNNIKKIKFVGFSSSGKTTLIEKLVKKFTDNGIRVATIKHDVHGLDIDKEGKDSYRFSSAGAKVSVVSSDELTVFKIHSKMSINDIISNVKDVDLIIIEGFSVENDVPTIGVCRKELNKGFKHDINMYAMISSDYTEEELKNMNYSGLVANINDIESNYKYIKTILSME